MKAHIPAKPFFWIKGESGEGYLCPVDAFDNTEAISEEELKKRCFADSSRPWND